MPRVYPRTGWNGSAFALLSIIRSMLVHENEEKAFNDTLSSYQTTFCQAFSIIQPSSYSVDNSIVGNENVLPRFFGWCLHLSLLRRVSFYIYNFDMMKLLDTVNPMTEPGYMCVDAVRNNASYTPTLLSAVSIRIRGRWWTMGSSINFTTSMLTLQKALIGIGQFC